MNHAPTRTLAAAVLFLLAAANSLAAQAPAVTLEALLGTPFPSELLPSTTGAKLAWVQNERGVRNVWVAEPPEYRARPVTRYTADDGQSIGNLEWSPDARTLVFVRGGSANRQGDVPNPASSPAGGEQAIWRVAVEGAGEPVRIAAGGGAVISPRGDGLVFTRRGQVFWAPLDGSAEPVSWAQVRGGAGTLRWSPDASRIAFVSGRGDHNFIGVLDVAGKSIRWIAPSVDEDMQPVWSPDGKRIAFVRSPANSKIMLFHAYRSHHPWSILVADVATGQAKTVWAAREGTGSVFREMVAASQILWAAGDRLVFPWEGDGWLHLYSVPAGGGEAIPLTPGRFEIEQVTLTPDRRDVLFSSNQDDIDRRHLWRVPAAGGTPVALTRGEGIEWMPAMTSDGKALAYLRAGARKPAHAALRIGNDDRDLVPGAISKDFPESALVTPQQVIYSGTDGMRIHAQLFVPPGLKAGERRPAVIFLHGGSHRQMLLGWHYSGYYHHSYALNQYLASRGYVVMSINYRAGIGYGMEFREALNQGAEGASEFQDVLGAGLYLRGRPDVDPARIGLWGGSYGGNLTAHGLARASDLFAAGVDIHGVHDWNVGLRTFFPHYDPSPEEERLAFQSSPMAAIDGWRSPVLVIHGDDDRNVSFSETVTLVEALRKRKVEVEQLVFPDEIHSFLRYSSWLEAFRATADFFDRKLGMKR